MNEQLGLEPHPVPRISGGKARRGSAALLVAFAALLVSLLGPLAMGARAQTSGESRSDWKPPSTVYIPESGHSIDGVFLDFWRANSGIANYGYPISAETEQNGRIVQYYTYARFEYWPEDPNGNVVQLGKLGAELQPAALQRTIIPRDGKAKQDDAGKEVAAMAKAWLPLDEKAADKANTDAWRYVPETKHSVANGFKSLWERTGEAAYLGNPLTEEYALKGITYQVFERGQLAWKKGEDPWVVPLGEVMAKKYKVNMEPVGQGDLPIYSEDLFIPPPEPEKPKPKEGNGEKWIEINLGSQYMVAWEGTVAMMETYVSTGRPGFDTPPGTFFVNSKLESQTMEGVLGGEYYNVPDVPWVMYFTGGGHAIHGAYWHSNFGAVMSHGCVNLPVDVAAWIYNWAPVGIRVEIHY